MRKQKSIRWFRYTVEDATAMEIERLWPESSKKRLPWDISRMTTIKGSR